MKKNLNKKGFTIVELVIVIVVIAILAAVLIPTFVSLVNKANRSADEQAVRQMNTLLATENPEDIKNITDARTALLAANIEMKDYKPLAKDMYFYWVKSLNRVVYADADNKVHFPKEYIDQKYVIGDWFSLSGEIVESDDWKDTVTAAGEAKVASGAELASLMNSYAKGDKTATTVKNITLTEDIDLMGSVASFGKVAGAITIEGNGKTIYGVNSNDSVTDGKNAAGAASAYSYGLFGTIGAGKTVTVKDVVISGAVIDDPENPAQVGHAGVIAGSVTSTGKLIIENVTIENCFVRGEKKIGAAVGYIATGGTVEINGLKIENTTVTGGREVAAVIGFFQKGTVKGADTITKTNLTVEVDNSYGYKYNDNNLTRDGDTWKAGVTTKDYWFVDAVAEKSTNFGTADQPNSNGPVAKDFTSTDKEIINKK